MDVPILVDTHPDCVAAAEGAARLLESLGHMIEDAHPAALEDPEAFPAWTTVVTSCLVRDLDFLSRRTGKAIAEGDIEAPNWAMAEIGRLWSANDYVNALEDLWAHTRRIAQWWAQGFDLLLTPTLASPPPQLGYFVADRDDPLGAASRQSPFVVFTSPYNITGQPAISLPLHWSAAGLPVGVQLVAAYGREDLLLRVAAQLEQAHPWDRRLPEVHA